MRSHLVLAICLGTMYTCLFTMPARATAYSPSYATQANAYAQYPELEQNRSWAENLPVSTQFGQSGDLIDQGNANVVSTGIPDVTIPIPNLELDLTFKTHVENIHTVDKTLHLQTNPAFQIQTEVIDEVDFALNGNAGNALLNQKGYEISWTSAQISSGPGSIYVVEFIAGTTLQVSNIRFLLWLYEFYVRKFHAWIRIATAILFRRRQLPLLDLRKTTIQTKSRQ